MLKAWVSSACQTVKSAGGNFKVMIILFIMGLVLSQWCIQPIKPYLDEVIKNIVEESQHLGGVATFFFIFLNNSQVALLSILLGVLLGVFPMIVALFNGLLLGYVMSALMPKVGFLYFWRLLPHGLFELPAVFMALALGLWCGKSWFVTPRLKTLQSRVLRSLQVYGVIILPLLFISAMIESALFIVMD